MLIGLTGTQYEGVGKGETNWCSRFAIATLLVLFLGWLALWKIERGISWCDHVTNKYPEHCKALQWRGITTSNG